MNSNPRQRVPGLATGALTGAAIFAGLYVYCVAAHFGFSVMGVEAEELNRVAQDYLVWPIISFGLRVLALYLLAGALLGGFSAGAVRGWAVRRGREPGRRALIAASSLGVLLLHGLFFGRALVQYPQLFSEFFYDRGGFRAGLQAGLTDRVGLGPVNALLATALAAGLGLWLAYLFRQGAWPRRHWRKILATAAVGAAVGFGVSRFPVPDRNRGPNLLILASDSVRPDRLSFSGYPRPTSPALDRLAAEGAFFDHAYSQLPRTFPAWVSLLTGEYPIHHGITSMFPTVAARQRDFRALPQLLSERGYATVVVADYAGDIFPRIELGFRRVEAPDFTLNSLAELRGLEIHTHLLPYLANRAGRRAFPVLLGFASLVDPEMVGHDAVRWLRRLRGEERFMLTVFMSCSHFPYSPPWPYYRTWTDPDYRGLSKYRKINNINADERVTPADTRQINALFDGAVRATDDAVGEVLEALRELELDDRTVVVFLSDHGENLYEGDALMGHGDHLRYDHSLKMSLIIRAPGFAPVPTVTGRVRSVDLFPTLLELLGVPPVPDRRPSLPEGMAGVSLVPALRGGPQPDLPVYAETGLWFIDRGPGFFQRRRLPYPDVTRVCSFESRYRNDIVVRDEWHDYLETAKHRMLVADGLKLIYCPTPRGIEWELYDLTADPEEKNNLAGARPDELARMQGRLFDFLRTRPGWTVAGDYYLPVGDGP